ncbi:hypothetical protein JYU20_04830, partial [Bacteroidales bacterium AH-315-I05]|nr:hypothetical protein [Bacteroidales bacterium AH-315-I05]
IDLEKDKIHLESSLSEFRINAAKQEDRIFSLETKINDSNKKISELEKENTIFKQTEEGRRNDYENKITELNTIQQGLKADREKLHNDRVREKEEEFEKMKTTWTEHEHSVESVIKSICKNYLITYLDEVPFRGKPDNTIEICDEYIIFDAKSPASDDLSNFSSYIKAQTENLKKYIKEENVKKDIFLVIPSNTVEVIKQFAYNMGDYNVYIVTPDALEPIMLSLKKIEEYEFAEQLRPEERDNICRIIGQFAHTTKRKIEIEHYFTVEFLQILTKCKNDLPKEVLEKVIEFERAAKLNPPQEKRAKQILTKDLKEKSISIQQEMVAKGILPLPSTDTIEGQPLYKEDR